MLELQSQLPIQPLAVPVLRVADEKFISPDIDTCLVLVWLGAGSIALALELIEFCHPEASRKKNKTTLYQAIGQPKSLQSAPKQQAAALNTKKLRKTIPTPKVGMRVHIKVSLETGVSKMDPRLSLASWTRVAEVEVGRTCWILGPSVRSDVAA